VIVFVFSIFGKGRYTTVLVRKCREAGRRPESTFQYELPVQLAAGASEAVLKLRTMVVTSVPSTTTSTHYCTGGGVK
jgi:hypothetical protein